MAINTEVLLPDESFPDNVIDRQYIISPFKFLTLNTLSFGFYSIWWIYSVLTLLCGMAPPPIFLLGALSGVFLVQPLMAFNFVLSKSPELDVLVDRKLTVTEIFIVAIGSIFWLLLIIAVLAMMFLPDGQEYMP